MTVSPAIRQMRNVVLIIGLAWFTLTASLLIGVAQVGGRVWAATPVVLSLIGGALATAGAAGTWAVRRWGPIAFAAGALIVLGKSVAYPSFTGLLQLPWGYLLMLLVFLAVVWPNWPAFRAGGVR